MVAAGLATWAIIFNTRPSSPPTTPVALETSPSPSEVADPRASRSSDRTPTDSEPAQDPALDNERLARRSSSDESAPEAAVETLDLDADGEPDVWTDTIYDAEGRPLHSRRVNALTGFETVTLYDGHGRPIASMMFDELGDLRAQSLYDEQGRRVAWEGYDERGRMHRRNLDHRDDAGQLASRDHLDDSERLVGRTFFADGQPTRSEWYDEQGVIESTEESHYEGGLLSLQIRRDAEGNVTTRTRHAWTAGGRLSQSETRNARGAMVHRIEYHRGLDARVSEAFHHGEIIARVVGEYDQRGHRVAETHYRRVDGQLTPRRRCVALPDCQRLRCPMTCTNLDGS